MIPPYHLYRILRLSSAFALFGDEEKLFLTRHPPPLCTCFWLFPSTRARVLKRRDVCGTIHVRTVGRAGVCCRSPVRQRLCRCLVIEELLLARREWQRRSGALALSACTPNAHGRAHNYRLDRSPRSALPARSRIKKRAATTTTSGTRTKAANSSTNGSWTRRVRSGGRSR